ncbi:hypothetical protein [Actibacterium lipolyticum]|uniref:Uncharacterized protein n=1 Tax=Actibacterium lipolyticum TaxID=1524263 RepID=A0A238KQC0_9RHOB|nr:hypothetical protein [Actibacterium lipolyticum]SMX45013.1 hypothetical protein COL8621_02694 [Actibacterium lipolyticum]
MQPSQVILTLAGVIGAFVLITTWESDQKEETSADGGVSAPSVRKPSLFGGGVTSLTSVSGKKDPSKLGSANLRGYTEKTPLMIAADLKSYSILDAVEGYPSLKSNNVAHPAAVTKVAPITDCQFRKPAEGEAIANVFIGTGSGVETGLHVVTDSGIAKSTISWFAEQHRKRTAATTWGKHIAEGALRKVDVVVTDTSAPVYLILQSVSSRILWNILPAEGVEIAHIAAVSYAPTAVNPPTPETPVEISNAFLDDCAMGPARKPADHWGFIKNMRKSGTDQNEVLANIPAWQSISSYYDEGHYREGREEEVILRGHAVHERYSNWFEERFGFPAAQDAVGIASVAHVLVGPMPAADAPKVPYRSISGSTVKISDFEHIYFGPAAERVASIAEIQNTLARQALGEDLTLVIPAIVERTE